MTNEDEVIAIRADLEQAISAILNKHDRMMTNWVVLVEDMDSKANRGIWYLSNGSSLPWDNLGMLHYGIQIENNQIGHHCKD